MSGTKPDWWERMSARQRAAWIRRLQRSTAAERRRAGSDAVRERLRRNARAISPEAARERARKAWATKRAKASARVDATSGT